LLDDSSKIEDRLFNKGKNETYTEKREALLQGAKPTNNRFMSNANTNNAPTEMEMAKMESWKKRDEEIDEGID
jgi:hypothetical protein